MNWKPLFLILLLFFCSLSSFAQISGTVTNQEGEPLPYVNIFLEGSVTGTTTNEKGFYELEINQPGNYTIVFQYLGYKTLKKAIQPNNFPFVLDAKMAEESISLGEVLIHSGDNPANKIMRNAIASRDFHKKKINAYTADFYSRGIWRLTDAPEKLLGQEIGDLGGSLDSTRSGVIYLSETISEITYRAPDDFKEKIIASKVSGSDSGFSLNSAQEATISFYNNTVELNNELISPIADYAFDYYTFKLEGSFYTDDGLLINKIAVVPKRPKSRTFTGTIYIAEDTWQIYGLELSTTGAAMQIPLIEELVIKQNYNFSTQTQMWVPISQTVDFEFGMFGIKGNGRFTAVYTNYDFNPGITSRTFTREILSFAPAANKKDSLFWKERRPIALTEEEARDYVRKDSIREHRSSEVYLDSVDRVENKFGVSDLLFGYNFRNSYENWSFDISSPLLSLDVNTVQGYNGSVEISFRKNKEESYWDYWRIFSKLSYGLSEEQFRVSGGFQRQFNNISKPILTIGGGGTVEQINDREPISEAINSNATALFERNYLKLYDLNFAKAAFQQDLFNGFQASTSIGWEERAPLFNNRTNFWVDREDVEFTSNNPLEPFNYNSAPFQKHQIFRFTVGAQITFGQEYLSYPNMKFNIPNDKYPVLSINYEKGFASDIENYGFDQLEIGLRQDFNIGNKGRFYYSGKAGTFFNDEEVSFLDYRHFNGNQTPIGTSSVYLNRFHLLPYYAFSTKENYAEAHFEHNFQGWILGRIPGINWLNLNLVVGGHQLYTANQSPYSEVSVGLDNLGFGKFRFFRLDYARSFYEGEQDGRIIIGLKFLDMLGL